MSLDVIAEESTGEVFESIESQVLREEFQNSFQKSLHFFEKKYTFIM